MNRRSFLETEETDESTLAEGDVVFILFSVVLFAFMLIIHHVHTAVSSLNEETFRAEVEWNGLSRVDVDTYLWCHGPHVGEVIAYRRKKGTYFVLNQDDLGWHPGDGNMNKEIITALASKLPHARCGLNIHVFGRNDGELPLTVRVSAVIDEGKVNRVALLEKKEFIMRNEKEEITVAVFEIDADGKFVQGSNVVTTHVPCAMTPTCGLDFRTF